MDNEGVVDARRESELAPDHLTLTDECKCAHALGKHSGFEPQDCLCIGCDCGEFFPR